MREQLSRLDRLVGTNPGFYVLALRSFVEHYLRDVKGIVETETVHDVTWEYRRRLLEKAGGGFVPGFNCLTALGGQ